MENVQQMSLLEVALKIMEEKGCVVNIYDLIKEVLEAKGLDDPDNTYASTLYTDITTSSKFVFMGEDNWDLKSRQSLDEFDKDGASFNPKGALDDEDDTIDTKSHYDDEDEDEEESEYDDLEDEDLDEDRDEDEDEDDEEESEYDDLEYEDEELEDEADYDDSLDEDKYNKIMDDYEDLYEN